MEEQFSYNLEHKYRGCALIIGNGFEGQGGLERDGCGNDLKMMGEMFTQLDFTVTKKENLKANEMREELRKAAKAAENDDSDCFVLVISTHGGEVAFKNKKVPDVWKHVILGEDGINGCIFVEEIVDMFSDENADGLKNKPKLFFLQACRSKIACDSLSRISNPKYDQGYLIRLGTPERSFFQRLKDKIKSGRKSEDRKHWQRTEDQVDFRDSEEETEEEDASGSPLMSPPPEPTTPFNDDICPDSTCPKDFLIMYPVMSGKSAFRDSLGSYLLQCLHDDKNLIKLLKGNNILQYLTSVSQDMAKYNFLPDLIVEGKPEEQEEKKKKMGRWIESNIKALSENKKLLIDALGKDHKKGIKGKDKTLVEEYLKQNHEKFTTEEKREILRRILPFKMSACLVHRLRDNVCLYPKSPEGPMAEAKKHLE